jgi:hypothetical protein
MTLAITLAGRERIQSPSWRINARSEYHNFQSRISFVTRVQSYCFAFILLSAVPCLAQTAPDAHPTLRRWFELQTMELSTRYRFIESSAGKVSSNDLQYKESVRARFNLDAQHRYTITAATASGSSFTSSWNYTGIGRIDNNRGDAHNHYLKQLFASATPVTGLTVEYGGLGVARGENTEFATYDNDGFLTGERVSVRRPGELYLDDITVTRARLGPARSPNVNSRWRDLDDPDYTQVLMMKRWSSAIAGSLDYSRQAGADTMRAAVSLEFDPSAPVTGLRYEQYHRFNRHAANGFVVTAERSIASRVSLEGGFAAIDQFYGGLNADRIQSGKRLFVIAEVPIAGPLSASFFATHAFDTPYPISNRRRVDVILTYDVLDSLRRAEIF